MAILYAAAHAELDLIGLTTVFGNVPVATATRNALFLAEMAGLAIPVAEGAAVPMVQPLRPHPDFIHGTEGFGDLPPARPAGTRPLAAAAPGFGPNLQAPRKIAETFSPVRPHCRYCIVFSSTPRACGRTHWSALPATPDM